MKKIFFLFFLFLLCGIYSDAQNVGIGDPAPSAKLTVSGAEATSEGQGAAIKLQNTSSANAWYIRAGGPGTTTPANGFSIGDNSAYHLMISPGGNTGLGINIPTARLHVNGNMKLEGLNTFEFGAGVAGKEMNAGKIGYNGFGTNALAIVGAGATTTERAVYFFAEGGTTFDGPISVGGSLQINGNPGTAGQVLTSNGTAAAEWKTTAYNNSTRFKVTFSTTAVDYDYMNISETEYNLNATDVTIGANSITINKSGLYRIQGTFEGSINYAAAPAWAPELVSTIELGGTMSDALTIANLDPFRRTNTTVVPIFYMLKSYSVDVHLSAGTVIRVSKTLICNGSPSLVNGAVQLYAHLIAE